MRRLQNRMPFTVLPSTAQLHRGERLTRYVWASRLIEGLDVLELCWDPPSGADVLIEGRLRSLTTAQVQRPDPGASLRTRLKPAFRGPDGQPFDLPQSGFDAVIAFDLIERVESPAMLVSELYHALRPDGFVVVSATGGVGDPSNGRIGKQLGTEQLERLLRIWFRNCRLHRQHMWVTSLISQGAMVGVGENASISGGSFPGLSARPSDADSVTIVVASNQALPDAASTALLLDGYSSGDPRPGYQKLELEVAQALEELETIRSREARTARQMREIRAKLTDICTQIGSLFELWR